MLLYLLLYIVVADATPLFMQHDYMIIHHRLEVVFANNKYIKNLKASMVPLNRTARAFNASWDLLMDLPKESLPLTVQVYKFSVGDYRVFPVYLNEDYCQMRKNNSFGVNDVAKYSNAPPCPIKKNHYYINKYRPDESKFPPRAVLGDYKIVAKMLYDSEVLGEVHWFGSFKANEKV